MRLPAFTWRMCVAVAVFALAVPSAVAAEEFRVRDVSATPEGRAIATIASARFASLGAQPAELRVWRDSSGYFVAPAEALLDVTDEGVLRPMTAAAPNVATASLSPASGTSEVEALAAAGPWQLKAAQCFARIWAGVDKVWMDHCYQLLKLANDGNGSADYFTLQHYATMHPNWPWKIGHGTIEAEAFTPQTWMDWSPRGDRTGACQSYTLSITVSGVGLSFPTERCETWDMTKWNPAVKYKLTYTGGSNADRELAFEIAVQVAQGAWPQWFVPAEITWSF